jgi:hypothetical protein
MTGRILREELISHCPLDSFVLASTLLSDQDFSSRLMRNLLAIRIVLKI